MNKDLACQHLCEMIRIPTISSFEAGEENEAVFTMFYDYLEKTYPHIYEKADFKRIGRRGLLFHIKGQDSSRSCVLMAHYDVVSADAADWKVDPFGGIMDDEFIYGRGTLDTKCSFCAVMESVDDFLANDGNFKNDVYLAFSGEEEVEGESAHEIALYLEEQGIRPYMVLDEGGAVIPEGVPGMAVETAMIGVAEKGLVNMKLTIRGKAGHASVPPKKTVTGRLAKAITAIEKHPFPGQITPATEAMFKYIGKAKGGPVGLAFRSIRLLKLPVIWLAGRMGGTFNAMVRSTAVATMLKGADSYPILPGEVSAGLNVRLLGKDNMTDMMARLKQIINDPDMSLEIINGSNPSPISRSEGPCWEMIEELVSQVWPGDLCVPYTMNGATDSRHFHTICDCVYKFTPAVMDKHQRASVHGIDEQIRVDEWKKMLVFYEKLMQRL
ncbi:MAG: M20/M25/M40 family metallo-hydrolase [Lachnospiraceae bacterium]|nr:M20/M25/M40 family metallo-hydrolase [Candidatus Equihabitans merdae]